MLVSGFDEMKPAAARVGSVGTAELQFVIVFGSDFFAGA
jgi:hypothetical protein